MSFEEVRNALVAAYSDGNLDDIEFLTLYDYYEPSNPTYPYWEFDSFCLDDYTSSECESNFRVCKDDLVALKNTLQIPDKFRCHQGTVCDGLEGLCLLLKRLAFPCRYFDLMYFFGRSLPEICMINSTVLDWMYLEHGFRLTSWNQPFLTPIALQEYCQSITRQGCPLRNCFGFVDGTVRPICRPEENQRVVYNGHKRVHALKFQSVALPNGLIGNLYGPVEGRKHDAGMLRDSGLLNVLERQAVNPAGDILCIYGDPAYPLRPQLMCPYRIGEVPIFTQDMQAFNEAMSSVRVSVEWLFCDVINYFKFLDFKNNLKLGMSAVGKFYIVAALFRNILTCLYGNLTSDVFQLDPPTVQNYLA